MHLWPFHSGAFVHYACPPRDAGAHEIHIWIWSVIMFICGDGAIYLKTKNHSFPRIHRRTMRVYAIVRLVCLFSFLIRASLCVLFPTSHVHVLLHIHTIPFDSVLIVRRVIYKCERRAVLFRLREDIYFVDDNAYLRRDYDRCLLTEHFSLSFLRSHIRFEQKSSGNKRCTLVRLNGASIATTSY